MTDLEEIEVRADLRELRHERARVLTTPPLNNQAAWARRSEWLLLNEIEITRLERLLQDSDTYPRAGE